MSNLVTKNGEKNVIAKKLNQMNQDELKAIISELDTKEGAKDIKTIEDKKLSAAKQKQEFINLAADNLGEGYEVGVAAKPNAKLEANTAALVAAKYEKTDNGYKLGTIEISNDAVAKSTPKQLQALMNPKAPKEEFKGYTKEELAAFAGNVNKAATFKPSGRHEDAKLDEKGHVTGVIKSQKQEARSGKTYYEIHVPGMAKAAWTRDTNASLVIGEEVEETKRPWYKAPVVKEVPASAETASAGKESATPKAK